MCHNSMTHDCIKKNNKERKEEEEKWEMREGLRENEAQENGGNKLWKLHISEKDFLSSVENGTLNGKEAG